MVLRTVPDETRQAAARFAEQRTIRAGIEAWTAITKAESFEGWKAIGRALQVGRDHALRATGANAPMGRRYSTAFCDWIKQHHFDRMPKSTRSVALELNENIAAIEAWRSTLTEKQRRRCVHPLSNVRRWRSATAQAKSIDAHRAATAAWRRFVACVEMLSPDQAAPLWRDIQAAASTAMEMSPPMSDLADIERRLALVEAFLDTELRERQHLAHLNSPNCSGPINPWYGRSLGLPVQPVNICPISTDTPLRGTKS